MEDEKMEWQARETTTRCRVEELESGVQVLTADLDNDRQHICTLTEALETAERAETNAKNRYDLQALLHCFLKYFGNTCSCYSILFKQDIHTCASSFYRRQTSWCNSCVVYSCSSYNL